MASSGESHPENLIRRSRPGNLIRRSRPENLIRKSHPKNTSGIPTFLGGTMAMADLGAIWMWGFSFSPLIDRLKA